MKVEKKPLAQITTRAIEVLSRELGPVDSIRFMNQFSSGSGNYTLDRDVLFRDLTLDQIIAEVEQSRGLSPDHPTPNQD